jgi:hypothetical protein
VLYSAVMYSGICWSPVELPNAANGWRPIIIPRRLESDRNGAVADWFYLR